MILSRLEIYQNKIKETKPENNNEEKKKDDLSMRELLEKEAELWVCRVSIFSG